MNTYRSGRQAMLDDIVSANGDIGITRVELISHHLSTLKQVKMSQMADLILVQSHSIQSNLH